MESEYPKAPVFSMSGPKLGFNLAQLVKLLLKKSKEFDNISPGLEIAKENEATFSSAAGIGEVYLPRLRALLIRYVTLVMAKMYPNREWDKDTEHGDGFSSQPGRGDCRAYLQNMRQVDESRQRASLLHWLASCVSR